MDLSSMTIQQSRGVIGAFNRMNIYVVKRANWADVITVSSSQAGGGG